MAYLFVLMFWLCPITIIAYIWGYIVKLSCSHIFFRDSPKKVELASRFARTSVFITFVLFILELNVYAFVWDTDPGLGDFACVHINSRYSLNQSDENWFLEDKEQNRTMFWGVDKILENENKILVSSRVFSYNPDTTYYILYEVDAHSPSYAAIDSAASELAVWSQYVTEHNIADSDIHTCSSYYWMYRQYVYYFFLIINSLFCYFWARRRWKKFFRKPERNSLC